MSTAARYRKRPVVIDAILYDGANHAEVQEFAGRDAFMSTPVEYRKDDLDLTAQVYDVLHSTWVGVKDGQWIIRGVLGEFYPCDADVFASTYDPFDTEAEPSGPTVAKWFCRNPAGREFEWPTEEVARGHVAEQGCALVKKTTSIAAVLSEAVVAEAEAAK